MLNIEINKEIKGDNKIILGLNLRQTIVSTISGIILLILYFNTQDIIPLECFMLVAMFFGAIAWWFGWHTKSGLNGAQHLRIIIKNYRSGKTGRAYVTVNNYTTLKPSTVLSKNKQKKPAKYSKFKPIA